MVVCFGTGFVNLSAVVTWGWIILRGGGGAVLCSVGGVNSILGLHPLNAGSIRPLLAVTTKNIFRHCKIAPAVQNHPLLRTTGSEQLLP